MRNLDTLVRLELEEYLLPKFFFSSNFKKVTLEKFNEQSMVDIYKYQAKGYGVDISLKEKDFKVEHFNNNYMYIIKITLPSHDIEMKEEVKVVYLMCMMYGERIILQQYFQIIVREGEEILQVKNFISDGFDVIKLNKGSGEKEELEAVMEAFEDVSKVYPSTDINGLYKSKRRGECKILKFGTKFQK